MSVVLPDRDASGRPISRMAATINGWHYHSREFEISMSKLDGVKSYDASNALFADYTCQIYDTNGTEITLQANEGNAVRTRLVWSPSYDYEVLGGKLHQHTRPTTSVRMSAIAGPVDLGMGYCKAFVPSINLKYVDPAQEINSDGRASKFMALTTEGVPVPTNKFEINFYYNQGDTHEAAMIFEVFKA